MLYVLISLSWGESSKDFEELEREVRTLKKTDGTSFVYPSVHLIKNTTFDFDHLRFDLLTNQWLKQQIL